MGEDELNGFVAWLATTPPAAPPRTEFRRRALLAFPVGRRLQRRRRSARRRSFRRLVRVAAAAAIAVTFLLPQPERWRAQLDGRLSFDRGRLHARATRRAWRRGARASLDCSPGVARAASSSATPSWSSSCRTTPRRPAATLRSTASSPSRSSSRAARLTCGRARAIPATRSWCAPPWRTSPCIGTTIGVLVDELGTCVCVAEGTAHVTSARLASGFRTSERSSLRVYSDPAVDPKTEAFPADDSGAEASHTGDLVQFLRGP